MGALCSCRHLMGNTAIESEDINRLVTTEELEKGFDAKGRKVRMKLDADGQVDDGRGQPAQAPDSKAPDSTSPTKGQRVQDRKGTGVVTPDMIPPDDDDEDEEENTSPSKGRRVQERKGTGAVTKDMIPPDSDEDE
mmetsp:Transcript_510/g.1219  ORF Transcript_510/g.1219 Transcript_510/m.1219 type:complete len:136 (-) Transcript_510:266-673(-)